MFNQQFLLGASLKSKLAAAVAAATLHAKQYRQFSDGFPDAVTKEWESMVVAWESDNSKPDPYAITTSCKYVVILLRDASSLIQ
jgi:hypothetical protein